MPLFVIFVFGAVVIGAGAMLSPAWNTRQPRIGLTAALALGIVVGGAVFWAMLFGWDTLVVDYLLFALVTAIFLFGTLSYGQKRAESRGETLADADQGWLSARDLLLFALVALIFVVPALILPVPLDTDAQGFGYLALTAREGGSFRTLAPFRPEISYLYAPGFPALTAYLSQQLDAGLHQTQFGIGAVLSVVLVLLAFDFGAEFYDKRMGRAMALTMVAGLGLFLTYMDSHYTTLLALVFAFACLIFALRYLRDRRLPDLIAGGLMLGAVILCHPDTTIILALGYAPFLITMWLSRPRPTIRAWIGWAVGIPLVALIGIAPWLWNMRDLIGADITSPFPRFTHYALMFITFHGVWSAPAALLGAWVYGRKRDPIAILCVGWLIVALDFAAFGILETLVPWLIAPLLRYDYPFSIAWHAPILPYTILGGMGVLWLWDRVLERRIGAFVHRFAPVMMIAAAGLVIGVGVFNEQILAFSKGRIGFYGAFSSHADVAAMEWLRANTPTDARILNHPGPHEADWAPVISERDTVYFRPQPFFIGTETWDAEAARLLAFWRDPLDSAVPALLAEAGIDYVLVPQIVSDPASLAAMYRWRAPLTPPELLPTTVADAPYLSLVFEQDGAQVYAVTVGS
jgi:hypothetical protein